MWVIHRFERSVLPERTVREVPDSMTHRCFSSCRPDALLVVLLVPHRPPPASCLTPPPSIAYFELIHPLQVTRKTQDTQEVPGASFMQLSGVSKRADCWVHKVYITTCKVGLGLVVYSRHNPTTSIPVEFVQPLHFRVCFGHIRGGAESNNVSGGFVVWFILKDSNQTRTGLQVSTNITHFVPIDAQIKCLQETFVRPFLRRHPSHKMPGHTSSCRVTTQHLQRVLLIHLQKPRLVYSRMSPRTTTTPGVWL